MLRLALYNVMVNIRKIGLSSILVLHQDFWWAFSSFQFYV